MKVSGRCLCGRVTVAYLGEPLKTYYCHCQQCRRASGSSFATNMVIRRDDLQISGNKHLRRYQSSPGKYRHFCDRCGSPIFNEMQAFPALLSLRCGILDDASEIAPQIHIHTDSMAQWLTLADDLPTAPQHLPGFDA